jgi:hypothetical protein
VRQGRRSSARWKSDRRREDIGSHNRVGSRKAIVARRLARVLLYRVEIVKTVDAQTRAKPGSSSFCGSEAGGPLPVLATSGRQAFADAAEKISLHRLYVKQNLCYMSLH